jgi:hypothetical protein
MRDVELHVADLDKKARIALEKSRLPEHPNAEVAEKMLLSGYDWAFGRIAV